MRTNGNNEWNEEGHVGSFVLMPCHFNQVPYGIQKLFLFLIKHLFI